MKTVKSSKEARLLYISLPLIFFVCISLWYVRNYYRISDMTRVTSDKGVFNLLDIDMNEEFVRLEGNVSYIPGILTPDEFVTHENEIQNGNPWNISSATSRIRIQVPDDKIYMLTRSSIDFAHRVYVNGELRFEAGIPADNSNDFEPGYAQMVLEVRPENGVIEIIQQGANFVHREGGGHTNLYFGNPKNIKSFLSLTFGPEYITVGLFMTLFLVHLVLYLIRRGYKPNLIFSLLCFTWMIRSSIIGGKVLYAMIPSLPWQLAFRVEYLTLPIAMILMILLIHELFSCILQKWFMKIVITIAIIFSFMCLILDTVSLSKMLMVFEIIFTISIFYLCTRFAIKLPSMVKKHDFKIELTISLIGFVFFMVATINDTLYYAGILQKLGFTVTFAMTGFAMLIFSFFQMIAMFYGTMRETMVAHEREQMVKAEKERLVEMNRLKSAFYADLSHEMKTPLTVIAVNAQFAAQNIQLGVVDSETVSDLNAISAEAKRLAQMVTSLVGFDRIQEESNESILISFDSLIIETARIYQTLFFKKNNDLNLLLEPNLSPVAGNADQLIQVIINLLSNANKHTIDGTVNIRTENLEHDIRVSVMDNGEGISKELLPHVFERYCYGKKGGSGLGLPICKMIIEEHGGEIGISSIEGKGTTVWFTLPIKHGKGE